MFNVITYSNVNKPDVVVCFFKVILKFACLKFQIKLEKFF